MTRLDKWAQAKALRDQGLLLREIGERMGLSVSTVHDLLQDPTGDRARARKDRYRKPCVDCGELTNPNGIKPAVGRCAPCASARAQTVEARRAKTYRTELKWSDEQIVAALRSVAVDGVVSSADYNRARETAPDAMPSMPLIALRFGRWAHAVEAAGLSTPPRKFRNDFLPVEGAWLAVEECMAALGHVPTQREYKRWASEVGAPCLAVVRRRLGGWQPVLALEEAA